ncbi:MAG: NAD-dependent epimerase/dehydratase family protein [Planctomycetes bacterium]|nr:NAD-dependent epimerase/dehydratase family protein [Planctomycetota bacterium]
MNLVTGGTGLLGSHIVEQLRKRGRAVRALVRKGADTSWLKTQGVELVEGDITDPASLDRACQGVQCIYHAAARVGDWGPWEDFVRVTIDGSNNLFDAAERAGVPRFIHISSISVYGHMNEPGLVVDESAPLGVNVHHWSYYTRAKVIAEEELWRRHRAGCKVKYTVIRPSWLYGPRDRATLARLTRMIREGKAKLLGSGDNRLNVVHAANVAEGCILAADNPHAVGQAYNCSNDGELTQRQYFDLLTSAIGAPPVTKRVPFKVAYSAGFMLECFGHLFGKKTPPMITRYAVWLMGRDTYFSADKARKELGWNSTIGYREGIPAAVKWYQSTQRA